MLLLGEVLLLERESLLSLPLLACKNSPVHLGAGEIPAQVLTTTVVFSTFANGPLIR